MSRLTLRLGMLIALIVAVRGRGLSAQQPVVLVHGGNSSAATWSGMVSRLQQSGVYAPYAYDLQPGSEIAFQAAYLLFRMNGDQLPSDVIVLAHSQGGLVSRQAAQWGGPFKGIVTIGTAHAGMWLGEHFDEIDSYFQFAFADMVVGITAMAAWSPSMTWEESSTRATAADLAYVLGDALVIGSSVALDRALNEMNSAASWSELRPDSYFLSALNGSTASEQTRYRASIASALQIGSYGAGPLALIANDPDYMSSWLQATGFNLMWQATMVWSNASQHMGDPDYDVWADYFATLAMEDLGWRAVDLGNFWNYAVGGYPHDGIVPTASMQYPGAPPSDVLVGIPHTWETSHPIPTSALLNRLENIRLSN